MMPNLTDLDHSHFVQLLSEI